MEISKITVRVPRELIEQAKRYARENNTTLTRLITAYLDRIAAEGELVAGAPIVKRLSGSLSEDATVEAYYRHLDEKYGRPN